MALSGAQQSRLGVSGFTRPPYGDTSGKSAAEEAGAKGDGHFSRLGLSGFPRPLYGSTAGKEEAEVVDLVVKGGGTGLIFPDIEALSWIRKKAKKVTAKQKAKRTERAKAKRDFRSLIEDTYLKSIGARPEDPEVQEEPFVWPDIPHPDVDISAMARQIGGERLQSQFDRIVWEIRQAEIQARRGKQYNLPVFYVTELMALAFGDQRAGGWWKKHFVDPTPLLQSKGLLQTHR